MKEGEHKEEEEEIVTYTLKNGPFSWAKFDGKVFSTHFKATEDNILAFHELEKYINAKLDEEAETIDISSEQLKAIGITPSFGICVLIFRTVQYDRYKAAVRDSWAE